MPRGNKTGPMGLGPMTGRGMGNCARNTNQELNNGFGFGRGMRNGANNGYNRGSGRGFERNFAYSGNQNFSNKEAVENDINYLKEQLLLLEKKLENLS